MGAADRQVRGMRVEVLAVVVAVAVRRDENGGGRGDGDDGRRGGPVLSLVDGRDPMGRSGHAWIRRGGGVGEEGGVDVAVANDRNSLAFTGRHGRARSILLLLLLLLLLLMIKCLLVEWRWLLLVLLLFVRTAVPFRGRRRGARRGVVRTRVPTAKGRDLELELGFDPLHLHEGGHHPVPPLEGDPDPGRCPCRELALGGHGGGSGRGVTIRTCTWSGTWTGLRVAARRRAPGVRGAVRMGRDLGDPPFSGNSSSSSSSRVGHHPRVI